MLDLIIIGGSAAGTAASVYCARRKLNFALITDEFGGEVATSGEIANYPSIIKTDGIELTEKFRTQLKANDVEPELGVRVEAITKNGDGDFEVKATKGGEEVSYQAKAVIIATGAHPRHLQIPGEEEFRGKGVTYCTTCDGPLFKGKTVVTIGGGNAGLESALMLSEIAESVTIINIHGTFKGEQVLIDKVTKSDKINIISNAKTTEIRGDNFVEGITYEDTESGESKELAVQGVFVHIGTIPNSEMAPKDVEKNDFKEIQINLKAETSVAGIFAAGDVTSTPFKQIAIATGHGVSAALSAIEYINKLSE